MSRPTCWVLKEQVKRDANDELQVFDYSGLEQYGNIEFITTFDPPLTPSVSLNEQWHNEVSKFIRAYNPNTDWIVPTGGQYGIFKLAYLLGKLNIQRPPQLLVWQNRNRKYYPIGVLQ